MYNPKSIFSTPMRLLIPKYKKVEGVSYKEYEEGPIFFGSFKSYGGTNLKGSEDGNGVLFSVIDTANIECYYRPDITSECRILNLVNNGIYDIIHNPEDVECRNKLLKFKVQRLKGD